MYFYCTKGLCNHNLHDLHQWPRFLGLEHWACEYPRNDVGSGDLLGRAYYINYGKVPVVLLSRPWSQQHWIVCLVRKLRATINRAFLQAFLYIEPQSALFIVKPFPVPQNMPLLAFSRDLHILESIIKGLNLPFPSLRAMEFLALTSVLIRFSEWRTLKIWRAHSPMDYRSSLGICVASFVEETPSQYSIKIPECQHTHWKALMRNSTQLYSVIKSWDVFSLVL